MRRAPIGQRALRLYTYISRVYNALHAAANPDVHVMRRLGARESCDTNNDDHDKGAGRWVL